MRTKGGAGKLEQHILQFVALGRLFGVAVTRVHFDAGHWVVGGTEQDIHLGSPEA